VTIIYQRDSNNITNVLTLQKIKDVKQELEQYKEHLSLAEFEITRVKQKNKELEDANAKT
jgi:hypothetical protein